MRRALVVAVLALLLAPQIALAVIPTTRPNASIRAQFYFADGEERVGCERNADPEYVRQAANKLAKQGYRPPEPPAAERASAAPSEAIGLKDSTCTLEQVAAMARAGLTDEQIRAACLAQGE